MQTAMEVKFIHAMTYCLACALFQYLLRCVNREPRVLADDPPLSSP